jgi:phosphohistidine phosphatase
VQKRRKCLILFRHAKSAWPQGVEDVERPLADRGKRAAPVMGLYLEKNKLVPDLVLVSTARRAQETWTRMSKAIKKDVASKNAAEIYEASPNVILDVVRTTEPDIRTLMLVGHNPGLEDLTKLLMKDTGGEPGARLREKFPTAAMAVISFDIADWAELTAGSGSLDRFVTPKSLGEMSA